MARWQSAAENALRSTAKRCLMTLRAFPSVHRTFTEPVQWGSLRRIEPVSRVFGLDRGQPLDRFYIESFLELRSTDIRGRVLEIADSTYTQRYGGTRVLISDVLHATPGNANATIMGDLASGDGIPDDTFDCLILTQTLPFIYDIQSTVRNCHKAMKPGGVVLATLPGISQISRYDMDRWGDYWRFTTLSAQRLFSESFGEENVKVESFGNVLAATAMMHGLAAHELTLAEKTYQDNDYQVLITVRAQKAGATP